MVISAELSNCQAVPRVRSRSFGRHPARPRSSKKLKLAGIPRSRRAIPFVLSALTVLLLFLWWFWSGSNRREPGLNVLLITIDTLRADAVGAYGRSGAPTPWIDRLADGGVRFSAAYAHNVVTLPSHANMLTGRLPPRHGVRDNAGFRVRQEDETIATLLQRQGYRTAAFVSAFPLDSRFGLDRGFEVYDDQFTDGGPRPAFLIQERSATATVALARAWIESAGDGPWFCWVHLYEPHFPYEPAEPYRSRWPQDAYMGEVAAADAALAPLLSPVLEAGEGGRTLVVVTSDHGESLGEHGEATHGVFAYESVLKVPLVVYQPRLLRPAVLDTVARHVDVLPTILDALALPAGGTVDGRSLLAAISGEGNEEEVVTYFEALSASFNRGWAPLVGVLEGGLKYIDLPVPELYDLRLDPREERNLAPADPERAGALRAQLDRFPSSTPISRVAESAEVRDRLRSLGYASGEAVRAPRSYTEADDPKVLIGLDTLLQDVLARYLEGNIPGALKQSRELVRRRPSMALSWMQLAHIEREAGNLDAAIDAMRRAVALNGGTSQSLALLGAYLTEAGRAQEAAALLEPAAREPNADIDVLTTRSLALARSNRADEALAILVRARKQDPSNAMLLVHVGTVQLIGGHRAAARSAFTDAVRLSPTLVRAHSSLAAMATEDEDRTGAFEHWDAATSLDPSEHQRILSLGIGLDRQGRTAAARICFEYFAANAPPSRHAGDLDRVRAWLKAAR